MAKQTINLGTIPNDGQDGDDARTAFSKVNLNFTELYNAMGGSSGTVSSKLTAIASSVWAANQLLITTGADSLAMLTTGANGRLLMAGADAAANRTNLGLGTSATATMTTSATDTVANRSLKVGDFGLGVVGTPPTLADIDSIAAATGLYRVANPTGVMPPGAGTYGTVLIERYSATLLKFTYTVNGDSASLPGSTWTKTYNGNATPAAWSAWQRSTVQSDMSAWGINTNIGLASPSGYVADIDNFDIPNGLYAVDNTTVGVKPPGQTYGMIGVTGRNFSVGRVVQTWLVTDNAGLVVSVYRRLNYARVWGTWIKDATMTDLALKADAASPIITGEVQVRSGNMTRFINSLTSTGYGVIQRVDTSSYYLLVTNQGDALGTFNALRPFSFNLATGEVNMPHGAFVGAPAAGDRTNKVPSSAWVGTEITAGVTAGITGKENSIAAGATSQYWRGDKSWRDLATDVRATTLTGVVFTASSAIAAADTLLVALGKLQAQINTTNTNLTTANTNLQANVRATPLTGLSTATLARIAATDTVLAAMGKLQAQADTNYGVGQAWQLFADGSGQRVVGTTYTNTTARPITVNFACQVTTAGQFPTIQVAGVAIYGSSAGSGGTVMAVTAIVPPGATYLVLNNAGGSVVGPAWMELR